MWIKWITPQKSQNYGLFDVELVIFGCEMLYALVYIKTVKDNRFLSKIILSNNVNIGCVVCVVLCRVKVKRDNKKPRFIP